MGEIEWFGLGVAVGAVVVGALAVWLIVKITPKWPG